MNDKIVGFVADESTREPESPGEAERQLCTAIRRVLDGPKPTEDEIFGVAWRLGYEITALTLSPHPAVGGGIRGGKEVRFSVVATYKGKRWYEIRCGTLLQKQ